MGAGSVLSGVPAGAAAFAEDRALWPNVTSMTQDFVSDGRVSSMLGYIGRGDADPVTIANGVDSFGGARHSDPDSLYRIYSMTKPITGMAAMILIDEGKLGLDQPVAELLPKYTNMQVQKEYDGSILPDDLEPAIRPMTIRHLLTHTAGLSYASVQQGDIAKALLERRVISGRGSGPDVPEHYRGEPVDSLALFADLLSEFPLVYQPGTRWSYSMALDLLGRVIEVASGHSFDAFLQDRIFQPCGMDSTYFTVPEVDLDRLTSNYGVVDGKLVAIDPHDVSIYAQPAPFPMGGSGLVSSPRDYDRFLKLLAGYGKIEGRRVMGELAVRVGTSNLFPDTMDPEDEMARDYGYGAGGRVGWAGFKSAFGWAGAASTAGFVDLDSGLRCGVYTQAMGAREYKVTETFENAISEDLAFQKGAS